MDRDIIVIGAGPGGYTAAIRAAQLKAKVTLVEKDELGGTCLNRGCIPTKTLYRNAELLYNLNNMNNFGISVDNFSVDVAKIQQRKSEVVNSLKEGISKLLKGNGVEFIKGCASLKDANTVEILKEDGTKATLTTKNIIIATGSKPSIPPIKGADLEGIFTSEEVLDFKEIPESLTVVGGGVVGMELACILKALGTKVQVVEFLPTILAQLDMDIVKRLAVSLKKKGIDLYTNTKVCEITKDSEGFSIMCQGKKGDITLKSQNIMISVGRVPVPTALNLESLGIEFNRKAIKVDDNYETNVKGIYAIGDVNAEVMLAHAAAHQGVKVAERIMGYSDKAKKSVIPACVFVFPELAYVGITEEEAKAQGISYRTNRFMFGANGKALSMGEGEGFVKVICSNTAKDPKDDVLLGVHIMGPHASDMIHEGTLAISNNLTIQDIKETVHAHPTLSEAFYEAVLGLNGEAIHSMN